MLRSCAYPVPVAVTRRRHWRSEAKTGSRSEPAFSSCRQGCWVAHVVAWNARVFQLLERRSRTFLCSFSRSLVSSRLCVCPSIDTLLSGIHGTSNRCLYSHVCFFFWICRTSAPSGWTRSRARPRGVSPSRRTTGRRCASCCRETAPFARFTTRWSRGHPRRAVQRLLYEHIVLACPPTLRRVDSWHTGT